MIKATESAGASTRRGMRCGESVLRGRAMEISPMEAAATTESTSGSIEVIAIDEHSAVGYIAVVIKKDIVVMPIRSPVALHTRAKDRIRERKRPQGQRVLSQWFAPACLPFLAMCSLGCPPSQHGRALPEQHSSRPAVG